MPIQDLTPVLAGPETATRTASRAAGSDPRLDEACGEFEGMLLGYILKQGFKPGLDDEEEEGSALLLTDFAAEQTARELGRAGTLGLADMLRGQLVGNGGDDDAI